MKWGVWGRLTDTSAGLTPEQHERLIALIERSADR
jgi:hypothetical protein